MATKQQPKETQLAVAGKALAVAGLLIALFISFWFGAMLTVVGLSLAIAGGAR